MSILQQALWLLLFRPTPCQVINLKICRFQSIFDGQRTTHTYIFLMINQFRCFGVNLDFTIKNSASTYFLQYVLLHWVSVKRAVRLMHATRVRLVTTKIRPTTHAKVDYYSSVYIGTYSRRTTVNT